MQQRIMSRRARWLLLPALLSATITASCSMIPTTEAARAIPCDAVPVISFSAPFMAQAKDEENIYDSQQTVGQVRRHNAAWRAVCQ